MAAVGSLEEEARKRKERLKALKKRQQGNNEGDIAEPKAKHFAEEDADSEIIKPVFKNYQPADEVLLENKLADPALPSVEEHIADQLSAGKPVPVVQEVDIMNLAPRKPDWDLKRDVAKKLQRLERRTQRAIAELIRERIQSGQEDLSTVASLNTATNQQNDSDSD
ncbi:coiled-coil domain-containing protein 12-like [Anneissia japonica]|uniref:coiled-coil domain-containing protein 12-like n=1 Tax=Anneissia japonica TaxID=1529436 RepID=UPI001425B29D|nr:coiled-coil domain-containing protein 12-like [Anneissia japonica]